MSSSRTSGTVTSYGGGYGSYSGSTTYTPSYGVAGSSSYSYSSHKRFVTLHMFNKSTKKLIYEAKIGKSLKDELLKEYSKQHHKDKKVNLLLNYVKINKTIKDYYANSNFTSSRWCL